MSRLRLKAVAVGMLVDTAGTIVLYFMIVINKLLTGVGGDALVIGQQFDIVGFGTLSIGIGMVTVGAFAAAGFAGRDFALHGGAIGVLNLLFFAVGEPFGFNDSTPLWYLLPSLVAVVPAGILGGYLAQLRDRRTDLRVNAKQ
jgi:hypothetical protein